MSIVSQVSIVLLIILTIAIIAYANKGLRYAEEEGEHFVDEWALKQAKIEEQKRRIARNRKIPDQRDYAQNDLSQGDRIQADTMRENESKSIPAQDMVSPYRLTVRDEEKKPVTIVDVNHYPYTIGRDRSNDLVLDDIYVARKHCVILEEGGQAVLKNQGSHNMIFAGGRQVEEYPLTDEGHFYIGTYEFIVSQTGHRSQPTIRYGS